jgi:hypothetical protein
MNIDNLVALSPEQQADLMIGLPTPDALLGADVIATRLVRTCSPEFLVGFLPELPPKYRGWGNRLRLYLQSCQWDSRTTQSFVLEGLSAFLTAEKPCERAWVKSLTAFCFNHLQLSGEIDATWISILEEIHSRPFLLGQ